MQFTDDDRESLRAKYPCDEFENHSQVDPSPGEIPFLLLKNHQINIIQYFIIRWKISLHIPPTAGQVLISNNWRSHKKIVKHFE